jgi:predicted DNA binding CopG/RHH family protein
VKLEMEPTNGTNKQLLQGLWRRSNCNAEENKENSILKCRNAFKKEKKRVEIRVAESSAQS